MIPAAPLETERDAGIEPGTAALQSSVTLAISRLSHHIPDEPPHPLSRHIPEATPSHIVVLALIFDSNIYWDFLFFNI
jgi:hypothetical protein